MVAVAAAVSAVVVGIVVVLPGESEGVSDSVRVPSEGQGPLTAEERGIAWALEGADLTLSFSTAELPQELRRVRGRLVEVACNQERATFEIVASAKATVRFPRGAQDLKVRLDKPLRRVTSCVIEAIGTPDDLAGVRFAPEAPEPDDGVTVIR